MSVEFQSIPKVDGREARATENRLLLIEAGMRLIEFDGIWRATVVQVSDEAGLSKRTFFNHFSNIEYFRAVLLADHGHKLLELAAKFNTPELVLNEIMK